LAMFGPAEIVEWTDANENGVGQTAICPHCGIDSVIGSDGEPLTDEILRAMHTRAFG